MKQTITKVFRIVPVVLIMGTIFFLSHQTGDKNALPDLPGLDKIAHMTAYGVLGATVLFAFGRKISKKGAGREIVFTVVICLLYGLLDEYHQSFIPGRTASGYDLAADCMGAIVACLLWVRSRKKDTLIGRLWGG